MNRSLPWLFLLMVTFVSCAKLGIETSKSSKPPAEANAFGPTGIPPALRGKTTNDGVPVTPGGNMLSNQLNLTQEEDIVFTDPDNPDAQLPELSAIISSAPKRRGPWEDSETIAKQRAAREGKPLLIWFTNTKSGHSPTCKSLADELFSAPDFEKWASEKLIRLRVDANEESNDYVNDKDISLGDKESRMTEVRSYAARLKKQYKVLGSPTLILCNPNGEVIGRYTGYQRGQKDFYWGLLKQGESVSSSAYQKWRAELEKKSYREWQDRKGRKVLAKLISYSKGVLILIEPDGTRCRTEESKLSDQDQHWISEQKKLRNLQ